MQQSLLGKTVHLPDSHGNIYQGQIVAAWLQLDGTAIAEIRVTVECEDRKFRDAWISNCMVGARPETEEEMKVRLQKRRQKEGQ